MTPAPFRLLPWEHGGVTPTPSQIIEARVEGRARLFEVKLRDNIAYLRRADEKDNRVWALWDAVSDDDLAAQFAREVEANRVGRYFAVERGFSRTTVNEKFWRGGQRNAYRGSYDLLGAHL